MLPGVSLLRARARSAGFAGLVAFHGLLLWQRLADASILEPGVLAKYAGALLLLFGVRAFHRYAPAHLRGRRAQVVFWLIVLLLHAVAPSSDAASIVELGLLVPLTVAMVAIGATVATAPRFRSLLFISGVTAAPSQTRVPLPARAPPVAA